MGWEGGRRQRLIVLDVLLSTTCSVPTDVPLMATMEASPPTGHDGDWAYTSVQQLKPQRANNGDDNVLASIVVIDVKRQSEWMCATRNLDYDFDGKKRSPALSFICTITNSRHL